MSATRCPETGSPSFRGPRRGAGRITFLFAAAIVWTACNSGDATAPLDATASQPASAFVVSRVVAPDTLRPAAHVVLEGTGFGARAATPTVRVAGVSATVVAVTPTRLEVVLPAAAAFPCLATGRHALVVEQGAQVVERAVTLSVARRLALAPGESRHLLEATESWCTELVAPAGEAATYALAVINTDRAAANSEGVLVSAARSPFTSSPAAARATVGPAAVVAASGAGGFAGAAAGHGAGDPDLATDAHAAHLARESERLGAAGSVRTRWAARRAATGGRDAAYARAPLAAGDLVPVQAMFASCAVSTTVTARVVRVGTRSVVLEDVRSPLAGRMDAELAALGAEFDAVHYPLLVGSVGDPLALDATMNGDGRVTMLFSPYVNDSVPGVSAYVSSCNLFPRTVYAASNEDELFYARVPRAGESAAAWSRMLRSTVVHEAKHLASFAERIARDVPFEEPWLEEATARVAEELYGRTFTGHTTGRRNVSWAESVQCELAQCDARPYVMWKHVPVLHDYFRGVDTLTPLGSASRGDVTWYASGWSLVRWTLDHFAADEGVALRDLVRGTRGTGLAALAALAGRPAEELLADWSLANLLDDRPGFTPARATLTFPSWHLPSLMAGLADMHGARYERHPLRARSLAGDQQVIVPQLRAFAASYFEAAPAAGEAQLLELRGAHGGAVGGAVRLAVVRVE
jgi:hypothetical protein